MENVEIELQVKPPSCHINLPKQWHILQGSQKWSSTSHLVGSEMSECFVVTTYHSIVRKNGWEGCVALAYCCIILHLPKPLTTQMAVRKLPAFLKALEMSIHSDMRPIPFLAFFMASTYPSTDQHGQGSKNICNYWVMSLTHWVDSTYKKTEATMSSTMHNLEFVAISLQRGRAQGQ